MEIYQFRKDVGKKNTKLDSDFILSRVAQTQSLSQIVCMYLKENGKIGYHQAVVPQLFLVVNGEGVVRGNSEEEIKVNSGDAVFWNKREWHETKTKTGLTAIVIECEALDISSLIAL
ncbi:cupin domain-containing protein [Rummeliibacillus stabekisii]|uniref:Cupin n=1 Tax=Rummeliibacillus stabekisii TaxID=241244 RepID=A0A143HH13_9BACL|nr:cupin domain-containing protein [Rummeliibacillus stabekisii]AMX00750.1 cupin [Rummeliibacillus stabekisii]